ncbi:MAG TPA: ANTAR domain-containing protein, partial [Gemmatimonadales bacterium]|nr:ANTAR domain-containing protein [Gemmatimonadales bacterium]
AKGILAERAGISMDIAFARLRGYAREQNRHLSELGRELIDGDLDALAVAGLTRASDSET